jgi:predicted dehydrogenase
MATPPRAADDPETAVSAVLVGCGPRGAQVGEAMRRSARLRLLAVCDLDERRLQAASQRLGVPGDPSYQRLLDRDDVRAVYVATDPRAHARVALDALAAGKHVLVEKPLADSTPAARALVDASRMAGCIAMVGYNGRFGAFTQALTREVSQIDPVQILLTKQRPLIAPQWLIPDAYGGVLEAATHDLDLALHLMGTPPAAVVGAVSRGAIRGDGTIECIQAIIEFDGGSRAAGVVASLFGVALPEGVLTTVQAMGTRGSVISLDGRVLRVVRHDGIQQVDPAVTPPGLRTTTIEVGGPTDSTRAMLDHFADVIDQPGLRLRGASFVEGMRAVAVQAALVQAAERGGRVPLADVL